MKLYYGCSQWGYDSWRGSVYPADASSHELLRYYARLFRCVEINSTFYNKADPSVFRRWKSKVSRDFKFCPKFPKTVSHDNRLTDCTSETQDFLKGINIFRENLGPAFLQLHKYFGQSEINSLGRFLSDIPDDFRICIEPRLSVIKDKDFLARILSVAKEHSAGIAITDSAETHPYLNNFSLTSHFAFIRFISYGHSTDLPRIETWISQFRKWSDKGLPEAFFFLHFPEDTADTGLVKKYIEICNDFNGSVS